MKYQILAGTLGLVLLMGLVPILPAQANVFVIDNFSDDNDDETCDFQILNNDNAPDGSVQTGLTGVIDGVRECINFLTMFDGNSNSGILVVQSSGMFRQMGGTDIETLTTLIYDNNGAGLAGGSCLDVTDSDDFRVVYSKTDNAVDVRVEFTDGNNDKAEIGLQMAAATNSATDLLFPINNFAINSVDLDDICGIQIEFETTSDISDWDIDLLDITMLMVGGEMFPVDTTALLLAGAELNAIWILPAIAAIGIGAFIVSRKRN